MRTHDKTKSVQLNVDSLNGARILFEAKEPPADPVSFRGERDCRLLDDEQPGVIGKTSVPENPAHHLRIRRELTSVQPSRRQQVASALHAPTFNPPAVHPYGCLTRLLRRQEAAQSRGELDGFVIQLVQL